MKINKYILGLAVAVMGGFSSCNTDVEGSIYNSDLEHVSFDGGSTSVSVSVDETTATIPVTINRGVVTKASTVTFTAEASEAGIFSNDANGSVSFAAGQNTVTFNVKAANLQKDQSYTYKLSLSDAAIATADTITGVKQNKVFTIKVSRDGDWTAWEEWNKEGTADYTYGGNLWSGEDPNLPFSYRQSALDANRYQFKLEKWGYGVEVIFDYDKSTGRVTCAPQTTGYTYSGYGEVFVTDLANFDDIMGWKLDPATDYGTFDEEKGIITIPLAYYIPAAGNGYFGYNPEYVYIDGYVRADYTTTVAYFGRLTNAADQNFLLADITFGKDVEYVKYALVTEAEVKATVAGLADGSIAGEKLTESGRVEIPVAESGTYYLVVVAFANGEAQYADYAKIKFSTGAEPEEKWTALYIGDYTYTTIDYTEKKVGGMWPGTITAVLYRSDSDASRYKIAPWADLTGEEGLIFTMDNEGVLTVDQVYTGYTDSKYGDVFATDLVTAGVADIPSYYDRSEGVFYFNLSYHDAEGAWTYVQDTFTLTGEASASRAQAVSKAKQRSAGKKVKNDSQLARRYFSPVKKLQYSVRKK